MNYLKEYLAVKNNDIAVSVQNTVDSLSSHLENFSFKEHITGLLLGNVQSGKTGQIFGIISEAADLGFEIFILLTSDNVYLQEQTHNRAVSELTNFKICSENDEILFNDCSKKRPTLLIIKKNTNILKTWKNNLVSSRLCQGRALFIIDDEGDAASMNTKINKKQESVIYKHLTEMKKLANSSIYLQVTATPQSILLQSANHSALAPSFVYYYPPGKDYMGGDFFYSEPRSYVIRLTSESELEDIRAEDEYIPEGLKQSALSFLVAGAHIMLTGGKGCNFLIHPSVRIQDHQTVANRIGEFLNMILQADFNEQIVPHLHEAWCDLQSTKPDITNFDSIKDYIFNILNDMKINIYIMNSNGSLDINHNEGLNIIIGGNCLGRGVTFEQLQTVYYCRNSKTPQADTFWQHCRMFGYNRDRELMRIFIPPLLLKLFTDLNKANQSIIGQIEKYEIKDISLIYPPNIKPTRANVILKDNLSILAGGVNYFPSYPKQTHTEFLDKMLENYGKNDASSEIVNIEFITELLEKFESEYKSDWDNSAYINCLKALLASGIKNGFILVRRDRNISKGTGTLLSPNDRSLGQKISDYPLLTLYRNSGEKDKGWKGSPFWIPNIKFPDNKNFYKMS